MSNFETALLNKLKTEQTFYALESLRRPGMKTEFEFGQRCGHIAGLEKAVEILLAVLDEERNGEKDLDARL